MTRLSTGAGSWRPKRTETTSAGGGTESNAVGIPQCGATSEPELRAPGGVPGSHSGLAKSRHTVNPVEEDPEIHAGRASDPK